MQNHLFETLRHYLCNIELGAKTIVQISTILVTIIVEHVTTELSYLKQQQKHLISSSVLVAGLREVV